MGLLQYKENQIYNEKASFLIAWTSQGRSWTLGNVLLEAEFRLLATNFICTQTPWLKILKKGLQTQPLEIEQSYELVHKAKAESSAFVIEEEKVSWYYDILKFLESGVYSDSADKRERHLVRMMAM